MYLVVYPPPPQTQATKLVVWDKLPNYHIGSLRSTTNEFGSLPPPPPQMQTTKLVVWCKLPMHLVVPPQQTQTTKLVVWGKLPMTRNGQFCPIHNFSNLSNQSGSEWPISPNSQTKLVVWGKLPNW